MQADAADSPQQRVGSTHALAVRSDSRAHTVLHREAATRWPQRVSAPDASWPQPGAPALKRVLAGAALLTLVFCLLGVTHADSALATGDVNSASCPFETEASPGFRGWLPDCRAYELVSPAFGAGALAAGPKRHAPPMSLDGEHLLAEAFGGFGEVEELAQDGIEYGSIFEFSRTSSGWTAEPQNPPASLYPWHEAEVFPIGSDTGMTRAADLGQSVWYVPGPVPLGEEPERIWVRRSSALYVLREGRGRFTVIGPVDGPGHERPETTNEEDSSLMGVSADAGHIVFSPNATYKQLWPGDETLESSGGRSLYEYHGTSGGEPVLIGVKNERAAPWTVGAARVNEGAQLESDCGTEYAGMSESGERVFFIAQHEEGCAGSQPAVNELYARVGGTRTVDISEPNAEDCAGCDVSEPRSAALFEGSSEDGSKVFFSSKQELFAGAHDEAGINLYEYDFNGAPGARVTFVARDVATLPPINNGTREKQHAARVAKDGTRVYFQSPDELTAFANGNGETPEEALNANDSTLMYVYNTETDMVGFVAGAREVSEPEPFNGRHETEPFKALDTTADGEYLVFETSTDLRGTSDLSTVPQVFEYDAATGVVARASVGQYSPSGFWCTATGMLQKNYNCDGNTSVGADAARIVEGGVNSVAEDGAVVFTSALALTPRAVETRHTGFRGAEGVENIYEYRGGQVYLISPDDEATPVKFQDSGGQTRLFGIDESGRDIFFVSGDRLVPQDVDSQGSWYDARMEGGFPAPAASPGCIGEACQGPAPPPPAFAAPNSNALTGSGNLAPVLEPKLAAVKPKAKAKACKKGFVEHKGRCVKASKSKKAKKAGPKRGPKS